jgi:hypothetical protein
MAIRPNELDRVVSYQLHICNDDVLRDRGRIKSSDTGHFINTIGTRTLPAKVPVWIDPHMAFFPGNLETLFLAVSFLSVALGEKRLFARLAVS